MNEQPKERRINDRYSHTFHLYLKVILWITTLLFIGTIISSLRAHAITKAVNDLTRETDSLEIETDAAKDAAIEARDSLIEAIQELEQEREANIDSSPEAIARALRAIDRIEQYLCGGPCESVVVNGEKL